MNLSTELEHAQNLLWVAIILNYRRAQDRLRQLIRLCRKERRRLSKLSAGYKNKFRTAGDTVWIKLTQGKETCIDAEDWPKVSGCRWYAQKYPLGWYAKTDSLRERKGKRLLLHQVLMGGLWTDHINLNGLDNRRSNLRTATRTQNQSNRSKPKNNTSGFKGVSWSKWRGCWTAQIGAGGKLIHLGDFSEPEEAAKAYDRAAKKFHGKFARGNFI